MFYWAGYFLKTMLVNVDKNKIILFIGLHKIVLLLIYYNDIIIKLYNVRDTLAIIIICNSQFLWRNL